jgi:TMEM175 potassium channel family protein
MWSREMTEPMAALEDFEAGGREDKGLDRILAFSDGVFAFSITLLALDLVVPAVATGPGEAAGLVSQLQGEWQNFLSYFLSFFIVGLYWFSHHRNFRYIRRYDNTLLWLNLFFLLFITLVPFVTKLLDEYETVMISVQLYAFDQAAAGFCSTLLWVYASRNHRLIDKKLSEKFVRYITLRGLSAPVIFVASLGVVYINENLATLFWLATFPVMVLLGRRYRNAD